MPVFTCQTCGKAKIETEFYIRQRKYGNSERRTHYSADCKRCYNAKQSAYKRKRREDPEHRKRERDRQIRNAASNPEQYAARSKSRLLKHKYGITIEEYNRMFAEQGGVCLICGRPETRTWKGQPTQLCVDHCHKTGVVRALLCQKCNSAVALVLECPDVAARLAWYVLEKC